MNRGTSLPISVLLPTYNCAHVVRHTLESVQWADEILVVDSYSTDPTLDVCAKYGARIVQHEYVTPATQKNWAIPLCKHGWILQMDSDEVLEKGLREEIQEGIASAPPHVHAFRLPRKNHVLGRWLRHGGIYPDYQIRLFRRDVARFDAREVHERICTEGTIETLRHHLLHYGMPHISKQLRNLDRYTRYEADEMRKLGKRFRWYHLLLRPWAAFFYRYLWRQGFREGYRGFILAAYLAMYDFLAHAKLWELETLGLERSPK